MNRFNCILAWVLCAVSFASYGAVPRGFESFFIEQQQSVAFRFAGSDDIFNLDALVTFEQVRVADAQELKRIEQFLKSKQLNSVVSNTVLHQLSQGVSTDTDCKKAQATCVVQVKKETAKYVFDYDSSSLRLFVSPLDLENVERSDADYHASHTSHAGVINHIALNAYSDLEESHSLSIDNKTIIGLGYGNLLFDTQYQSNIDQLKTYTAQYELLYERFQLQAGQHRYNFEFNSTDFLYSNADYSGVSIAVGTSKKLMVGGENQGRHISFYAPQTGLLQLYRNDRIFASYPVEAGLQKINYAEIPSGAYTLRMVLLVSGKEVFDEQRTVINHSDYHLSKGEADFRFDLGWLEEEWLESGVEQYEPLSYGKVGASTLLAEPILVAASTTYSDVGQIYQLGGKLIWERQIHLDYAASFSDHDSYFQQASLGYHSLFLNFHKYHLETSNTTQLTLSDYLYNDTSYSELSAGWSGAALQGQAFVRLYRREYQPSGFEQQLQRGISLGWSKQYKRHSFDISTDIESTDSVDVTIRATWRIALSESLSSFTQLVMDEERMNLSKLGANYRGVGKNWTSSSDLTWYKRWDDGHSQWDTSHAINVNEQKWQGNGYAFASSDGQKNISTSFLSTVLVNSSGVSAVGKKSDAYLHVNTSQPLDALVYLRDEKGRNSRYNYSSESMYIPLKPYQMMSLMVDASGGDIEIDGSLQSAFIHKGIIWDVDFDAQPLISQIVVVEQDTPDASLSCGFEVCEFEPLSADGVYRVRTAATTPQPLSLFSNAQPCQVTELIEQSVTTYICP